MDSISKVIIKRVLSLGENKPYLKFALFKLYQSEFLKDILYREFNLKIKDIEYSKNGLHGVYIYKCIYQKREDPQENSELLCSQIQETLDNYTYLINNNLLMVNSNWPYKLINIKNGKDTLKTIKGDAREMIRTLWNNEHYQIFIKYKGIESVIELMTI